MIMKLFFLLIFSLLYKYGECQSKEDVHINFILIIDDEPIISCIYDCKLVTKKYEDLIVDTIEIIRYEIGNMIISNIDYKKLVGSTKILLSFEHEDTKTGIIQRYKFEGFTPWFLQRYIVFKVYNYENKRNHKKFSQRLGYGIEIHTPLESIVLARKKRSSHR